MVRERPTAGALVVEDLRSLRRWLAVLGALAVIATAVAVYAILESGDSADEARVRQLERRVNDSQRRLRATSEESDVNKLEESQRRQAEETDVKRLSRQVGRLDGRIRRLEADVVDALDTAAGTGRAVDRLSDRVDRVNSRVGDVNTRIDDLEDRQPGGR